MLTLLIKDELMHLRRSALIQGVLLAVALLVPTGLLASKEHVQVMTDLAITGSVHLAALITGSVVAASLISDLQQGIPILFVVRPVPRAHFLLARGAGMTAILAMALGVGVGTLMILNATLVRAPLDPAGIVRNLLLAQVPGLILAMACGLFIGVSTSSIPSGLAVFMLLANALVIALHVVASKLAEHNGLGQAGQDRLLAAMTLLAALALGLLAFHRFSRRSI